MSHPVPTLDELAAHPGRACELAPAVAADLLVRVAGLQPVLLARVLSATTERGGQTEPPAEDRLLTPAEAAARLGTTLRWLYRHANRLPFTRRLSRKVLRFSEVGLARWLAARKGLTA